MSIIKDHVPSTRHAMGKQQNAEEDDLFQHLPSQAICFDLFAYPVSEIVETLCVSEMP